MCTLGHHPNHYTFEGPGHSWHMVSKVNGPALPKERWIKGLVFFPPQKFLFTIKYHPNYSKEVWKSNFRQYGEMEKQRWEESGRRRKEVRGSEKRKSEKKEDAGARKGKKVTIHCVFSNDLWLQRVEK